MSDLSNRFPESVTQFWIGWYRCLECKKNHADCLHHIISPQSGAYVKGKHNKSIYNSCPLNNWDCHLGKPLHSFVKEREYLIQVKEILRVANYKPTDNDKQFLKIYARYY